MVINFKNKRKACGFPAIVNCYDFPEQNFASIKCKFSTQTYREITEFVIKTAMKLRNISPLIGLKYVLSRKSFTCVYRFV